jgi:hypothetical protein
VIAEERAVPPLVASARPQSLAGRLASFAVAFAAVAPFVFFLFFVIRGGWLAVSVALMTFPSSLIWLCLHSVPQGAFLGVVIGLIPERWPLPIRAALATLFGAAVTIANSLWLGLSLVGSTDSPANLVSVGLIGGAASLLLALVLWYALRPARQRS